MTRAGTAWGERTGFRLSWGAVFAGFVVATALQMVLTTLGAAIGLTAFDPGQGDSAAGLGIGAALWVAVTAIASMFVGGMTAGRLAGVLTRGDGMLHGVILWSLSLLLALYIGSMGLGSLLGGVTSLVTRTASAAVGGVAGAAGGAATEAVRQGSGELDFDALQREVLRTLEQTGNPALSPDSLRDDAARADSAATRSGASNEAVAREIGDLLRQRRGEVGRDELVNVIAARTGRSRAEAEQIADRVQSSVQSARAQLAQVVDQAQEKAGEAAGQAANATSKGLWGALLLMGLSVAAAAFGAARTAPE